MGPPPASATLDRAGPILPRLNFRFGDSGFYGLARTLNTLRMLSLVGFLVCGFPSLDGNSVLNVRACIGFDLLDVEASRVAFAIYDEPVVFDKPTIIPSKQPSQFHATRIFQLRSRLANKSIEALGGLTQLDHLRERIGHARLHARD